MVVGLIFITIYQSIFMRNYVQLRFLTHHIDKTFQKVRLYYELPVYKVVAVVSVVILSIQTLFNCDGSLKQWRIYRVEAATEPPPHLVLIFLRKNTKKSSFHKSAPRSPLTELLSLLLWIQKINFHFLTIWMGNDWRGRILNEISLPSIYSFINTRGP